CRGHVLPGHRGGSRGADGDGDDLAPPGARGAPEGDGGPAHRMSRRIDGDRELARLLQALPAPEPSAEFLTGARRRYLAAIEARERSRVLKGLAAAVAALAVAAVLAGAAIEPVALAGWLAEGMADLTRWTVGIGVVVALVPPAIWVGALLGSAAAVLSIVLV